MSTRIAQRALPNLPGLLAGIGLGALAHGAQVALLATSGWLITRAAEQPPILYLTLAIVAVRAFALSRAVFRYLERLTSHHRAFVALEDLRVWIYRRLVPLAPAGLTRTGRGDVLSTVVRDVDTLQDYPLRVVQPVSSALVVVVAALTAIAIINPFAALALMGVLVGTGAVSIWLGSVVAARAERAIAPARAALADCVMDTVQRRAVLAAYQAEDAYDEQARRLDQALGARERRVVWAASATGGLFVVASGLAVVSMVAVTRPEVASGDLSGPMFALLVLVPLAIVEVFLAIPQALSAWRRVSSAAQRIDALVPDTVPEGIPSEPEEATAPSRPVDVESLVLRGFRARWPHRRHYSFAPVDIELAPGDRLVIEGPSGVGKSTLASALVGFVDYAGQATLNGIELADMPMATRRATIVLIEQRPHLFDTTIRHNLSFAHPGVTDDRLRKVLEAVGLWAWVEQRGGLDTPVGEAGVLVSGGQAQRIAVARALLTEAPIVVLDEPTANVDRAVADELMVDLLTGIGHGHQQMAIVISHVPLPSGLTTQRLQLVEAEV